MTSHCKYLILEKSDKSFPGFPALGALLKSHVAMFINFNFNLLATLKESDDESVIIALTQIFSTSKPHTGIKYLVVLFATCRPSPPSTVSSDSLNSLSASIDVRFNY